MFTTLFRATAVMATLALGTAASADGWLLDGENSRVSFGSVKKDTVGETHTFSGLSGTVGSDGMADITIDLSSVETNIDIRNERMNEHVFGGVATAKLTAELDMADIADLETGSGKEGDISATLSFLGTDVDVDVYVYITRLTDSRVLVTSDEMLWVSTEDLGVNAGVDKLMELAKLPGITRTVPITFRLMFDAS